MTSTTFTGPVVVGEREGAPNTQTIGFVPAIKQISLSQANPRQVVTLPPKTTILRIGAIPTSAITGDKAQDMNVSFGTSGDSDQFGIVQIGNQSFAKQTQILTKQVSVGAANKQAFVHLPPESTLLRLGVLQTSAFSTPGDAVSAAAVKFGTATDLDQYGAITNVSALNNIQYSTPVSGAMDFGSGGTIVISCSAETTSVFTNGGARAFVEYAVVNDSTGLTLQPAGSAAASFDTGGTVCVSLSAAATTTFTGGGCRAFIEYIQVE